MRKRARIPKEFLTASSRYWIRDGRNEGEEREAEEEGRGGEVRERDEETTNGIRRSVWICVEA